MLNKKIFSKIFVIILVLLTNVTIYSQENGGKFTLINIPSQYDGKYAILYGQENANTVNLGLIGVESINRSTNTIKLTRIINGKVVIPIWYFSNNDNNINRYIGNHTFDIIISIYNSEIMSNENLLDTIIFEASTPYYRRNGSVNFINGNAERSWHDALKPLGG